MSYSFLGLRPPTEPCFLLYFWLGAHLTGIISIFSTGRKKECKILYRKKDVFHAFFFSAYNYIIYQRHGLPEPTQNHPSSIFAFFLLLFLSLLFFHSGPRLSPPRELAPDHHPLTIESEKKATLRIFYLLSYPTYPTTSLPFFRCGQRQLPATSRNIRIDKTGLESRRASRKIKDKRRKRKKKRQENER